MSTGDGVSRVALVTGGGRGIGRGISRALAGGGYAVALTYVSGEGEARATAAQIAATGGRSLAVRMAVEDRASVRAAVDETRQALGEVVVLVNNAAVAREQPFLEISDADWDQVLAINLRGPFACCQEVLPAMLAAGWGRIINISSVGGQWGGTNQVHYASAKAALNNLTRSLARLYSARGVTTNTVAPGLVSTAMIVGELATDAGREKVRHIPLGRIATVDEVAQVVRFLASDDAGYITGQTINVNGGMYFG